MIKAWHRFIRFLKVAKEFTSTEEASIAHFILVKTCKDCVDEYHCEEFCYGHCFKHK